MVLRHLQSTKRLFTRDDLEKIAIQVPTLLEQGLIVEYLGGIEKCITENYQKLSQIQSLKKSDARPSYGQSQSAGELMAGDEFEKVELPAIEQLQSYV